MVRAEVLATADEMLMFIKRRAMAIEALAPADREARYTFFRNVTLQTSMATGMSAQGAEDFANKVDEWTRAIVRMLEGSEDGDSEMMQ